MPKQSPVRVSRSDRDSVLLPLFIILVVTALVAAALALLWQRYQDVHDPDYLYPPLHLAQASEPSQPDGSDAPPAVSSEPSPSSSEDASSQAAVQPVYGQPLPQSERVRSEYFDDAVFIGDSITTGIQLYDLLPNSHVVAYTGINLDNILTKKVMNDESQTLLEAATALRPKKIYIMLGANGLAYLSSQQTADYYGAFVDAVKQANPEAIVYVQSILPIEEGLFAQHYPGQLTNAKIDECNGLLLEMTKEKQVHYLDVASAFRTETGGLSSEVTNDGLHFKSDSYTKWIDYLKTHTITEDK